MTSIGDSLGRAGRPNIGQGFQVAPADMPDVSSVVYPTFRDGLLLADSPANVPDTCGSYGYDMEANRSSRIIRSPGIVQELDVSPRLLRWIFEQASLDYATELVAIDPPYFGFKSVAGFTWVNAAIGTTGDVGWNAVNYAGTLLFSNGLNKTYSRDAGAAIVTDISSHIVARTMTVVFGRIFAGYYYELPGLSPQSIGVAWNGSSGDPTDWTGAGSGAELLIGQQTESDKVVALRNIGFDVMGILMRKSLWAGYPTGDLNRPADFRPRFEGLGCVGEATAKQTPGGIAFLSDEGVVDYNVSNVNIISGEINSELLPIDYSRLDQYIGFYNPIRRRYNLITPFCHWIYEYPMQPFAQKGRWFRRSLIADNGLVFTDQSGNLTWQDMVGDWESQTKTWAEMTQQQEDAAPGAFFVQGSKLGIEDSSAMSNFGTALTPVWRTANQSKTDTTEQVTTLGCILEYTSTTTSTIRITVADSNGEFSSGNSHTYTIASTSGKVRSRMFSFISTGTASEVQLETLAGDIAVGRVTHLTETPTSQVVVSE